MSTHIYQTARRRVPHDNLHRYRHKNLRHNVAFKFCAVLIRYAQPVGVQGKTAEDEGINLPLSSELGSRSEAPEPSDKPSRGYTNTRCGC